MPVTLTAKDVQLLALPQQLDDLTKLATKHNGVNSDLMHNRRDVKVITVYSFGREKDANRFRKEAARLILKGI